SAEARPGTARVSEAADDELVRGQAPGFQPVLVANGSVRGVDTLRDDPFEAEPAGRTQHLGARYGEVLRVANTRRDLPAASPAATRAEQFLQDLLALQQRLRPQVEAVEVEKIESLEDDLDAGVRAVFVGGRPGCLAAK